MKLTNTLGDATFHLGTPAEQPVIKMYVCGLTPYAPPHIGHAMPALRFDVLRRYLSFRGHEVQLVHNVTDIDDKIIERVNQTGQNPAELTEQHAAEYFGALTRLGVLPYYKVTKVTEYVPQIINFIEVLIKKGAAYATTQGNVYFDVEAKSDYGKLSRQDVSKLRAAVRKELEADKRSPLDFALWKADQGPLTYRSPWGVGRPGWHIECSAMIDSVFHGAIDIHGGGLDLKFPHHENEIAQSEAYLGGEFCRCWMHNGLMLMDGVKMSKSLGNVIGLVEAVDRFGPELIRFTVLRYAFRSPVNFSDQLFADNLNALLDMVRVGEGISSAAAIKSDSSVIKKFKAAMEEDFNTPQALVAIQEAVTTAQKAGRASDKFAPAAAEVRMLGELLGFFQRPLAEVTEGLLKVNAALRKAAYISESQIEKLLEERKNARAAKNFAVSDRVRDELAATGIEILDSKEGSSWRFSAQLKG